MLIAWFCLLGAATSVFAADEQPCQIHIVLFTPADVKPPTDYQTRVDDLVASQGRYTGTVGCKPSSNTVGTEGISSRIH